MDKANEHIGIEPWQWRYDAYLTRDYKLTIAKWIALLDDADFIILHDHVQLTGIKSIEHLNEEVKKLSGREVDGEWMKFNRNGYTARVELRRD